MLISDKKPLPNATFNFIGCIFADTIFGGF